MSEENVPYTTNGGRHGQQHPQDEELTMALSALRRLHAALETLRSTEAAPEVQAQALRDGQQASGILGSIVEDWYDELVSHQERARQE